MSVPAGHIITVGGLNVIDRLQDAGLQNPRVPTETIRETGNDLVVGKVLTEADFSFQLQSWDVSCDMMALLTGKVGGTGATEGPSAADEAKTKYKWENCQFVNLACPWARNTGSEGGNITSGILIPAFYPSALSYKFGVTANAEQTVTLNGGSYYMAGVGSDADHLTAFPIEQVTTPAEKATSVETAEIARGHRIGGVGSTKIRHVFGVLRNGVIQQEGVDYVEEGGTNSAELIEGAVSKKVKLKFTKEFSGAEVVKLVYFSDTAHAIAQAAHASTTTTPAAVRGRNIEVLIGPLAADVAGGTLKKEETLLLRGVQSVDLNATHTGSVQREMGTYDPIGYTETGIDANGTITIDPKEANALYAALEAVTGVSLNEVLGYINEHTLPLKIKIYDPKAASTCIKSIRCADAKFQIPGTAARVNQTLQLPISWESEAGTFEEVKGE